jgi:hypothetical protein
LPRGGNDVLKRLLQHRGAIGNLAVFAHVREVEGHDVDSAGREPRRRGSHERMLLPRAGAMCEHEQRIRIAVCSIANRTERRQIHWRPA